MAQNIKKLASHQWQLRFSQNLKLCKHIWKRLCSFFNQLHDMLNWLVNLHQKCFFNMKSWVLHLETLETKLFWLCPLILSYVLYSWSPANKFTLTVNNKNTRTRFEIRSKLLIKTSGWHHWYRSVVFIVNFEHISHLWTSKCLLEAYIVALYLHLRRTRSSLYCHYC